MKILILCIFTLTCILCLGQDPQYYRVNKKNKLVELRPQDNGSITMYQLSGLFESAKKVIYIDSANHFKVTVPKWLKLKETNSLDYFGGVLPPINKIENAIVISSVKKENYKSFNEFKKFIVEDSSYAIGIAPKWANDRVFLGIEKDSTLLTDYNSYKVTVDRKGNIFISNFVLMETITSFLWVQFTATKDTYQINISKFIDFLKGLETEI